MVPHQFFVMVCNKNRDFRMHAGPVPAMESALRMGPMTQRNGILIDLRKTKAQH
jgi:hypothetical protein